MKTEELALVAFLGVPDHRRISKFRGISDRLRNISAPPPWLQPGGRRYCPPQNACLERVFSGNESKLFLALEETLQS